MTLRNIAFSQNQRRREQEGLEEYKLRKSLHEAIDSLPLEDVQKLSEWLKQNKETEK